LICTYLAKRLRELSSTKTGSYPHEFLCRTNCSACADYQSCFCPFSLAIVLFVLRFTNSDYTFGIFKRPSLHYSCYAYITGYIKKYNLQNITLIIIFNYFFFAMKSFLNSIIYSLLTQLIDRRKGTEM
jgi:hypothetical protein